MAWFRGLAERDGIMRGDVAVALAEVFGDIRVPSPVCNPWNDGTDLLIPVFEKRPRTAMPVFSLRALCVFIAMTAILLAICTTPRGRITERSVAEIRDGMKVEEAIGIVGLEPGWYDGIHMLSGLEGNDKGNARLQWVNIRGAIVVDIDKGELKNARFFSRNEFYVNADIASLLFDRVVQRIWDYTSPWATVFIFMSLVLGSLFPSVVLSIMLRTPWRESFLYGIVIALITLSILFASLGRVWIGHHDEEFILVALLFLPISAAIACIWPILSVWTRREARRESKVALGAVLNGENRSSDESSGN